MSETIFSKQYEQVKATRKKLQEKEARMTEADQMADTVLRCLGVMYAIGDLMIEMNEEAETDA